MLCCHLLTSTTDIIIACKSQNEYSAKVTQTHSARGGRRRSCRDSTAWTGPVKWSQEVSVSQERKDGGRQQVTGRTPGCTQQSILGNKEKETCVWERHREKFLSSTHAHLAARETPSAGCISCPQRGWEYTDRPRGGRGGHCSKKKIQLSSSNQRK